MRKYCIVVLITLALCACSRIVLSPDRPSHPSQAQSTPRFAYFIPDAAGPAGSLIVQQENEVVVQWRLSDRGALLQWVPGWEGIAWIDRFGRLYRFEIGKPEPQFVLDLRRTFDLGEGTWIEDASISRTGEMALVYFEGKREVWQLNILNGSKTMIADVKRLSRLLGREVDPSKTMYGGGSVSLSPEGGRFAISVESKELLFEAALDYNSEAYVVDIAGDRAVKLGLGDAGWLDETHLFLDTIEPDPIRFQPKHSTSIVTDRGELIRAGLDNRVVGRVDSSWITLHLPKSKNDDQASLEGWSEDFKSQIWKVTIRNERVRFLGALMILQ